MTQHRGTKSVTILLVLGVVILLGIYTFRFLDPLAAIALSAIVLVAAFYFSLRIWKVRS